MGASPSRIEINGLAQIEHLVVPGGWAERPVERHHMQLWTLREFHPPDRPSVRFYIYYRGHPVSENSGEAFESVLAKPPHDLDESEWWSVQEIVRNAALETAFERRRART